MKVWLSDIWHNTASVVVRFTKANPTTGEMPLDSLMAQMICWSRLAKVDAAVLGRPVRGLPALLRLVSGRGVAVVSSGYDVEVYDTLGRATRDIVRNQAEQKAF